VVKLDEKIVGFAYIEFEKKNYIDAAKSAAKLHDIYIEPEARARNAGKLLLDAVADPSLITDDLVAYYATLARRPG